MQSNINFDFPKMTKNWHKSRIYQKWPLDDLRWPWRLKLTTNHQINIFIWFLDPKNILKMVSFVILTFFNFPIWPPAAILNYGKCSTFWNVYPILSFSIRSKLYKSIIKKTFLDVDTFRQNITLYTPTKRLILIWIITTLHEYLSAIFIPNNYS